MTEAVQIGNATLYCGDCLDVLKTLPDASIEAIVTDPPYGLAFMGKHWDYDVPDVAIWQECLRVLKPGGHLLAFAGTRTHHRMAVRIEDAGFEIRDMIAWVYGSGFPKSMDVSKAIDKCNGEANRLHNFTAWMRTTGLTASQLDLITNTNMGGHYLTAASQPAIPTAALWDLIRPHCGDVPAWVDALVQRIEAEREVVGQKRAGIANPDDKDRHTIGGSASVTVDITAPATAAAKQWEGWGTALKPALEPIALCRKPLDGTVAQNVLTHGTGAINVDGCRVESEGHLQWSSPRDMGYHGGTDSDATAEVAPHGRWPANVVLDPEAGAMLDEQSGTIKSPAAYIRSTNVEGEIYGPQIGRKTAGSVQDGYGDSGGASRFFYCAKASRGDRGPGNNHPTVKPTGLMQWLVRLVTPPGGTILDPFMGSGSTGRGAALEGFHFIGIEREPDYLAIAQARIKAAQRQPDLFHTAVAA